MKQVATLNGDPGRASRAACAEVVANIAAEAPAFVQICCDFAWPAIDWLANQTLPAVRAFVFDTYFQTQTRQSDNVLDLAEALRACPNVEQVFATGALEMTKTTHDKLRVLHVLGDPLSAAFLAPLGLSKFPALQRLVVSLASDRGPGDQEMALAMLGKLAAPSLRTVYIDSLKSIASFLDAIAPRAASLKELHLGGDASDEDELVPIIEKHVKHLRHLEVFALSLDDISEDAGERIRALVPSTCEIEHDLTIPAAYNDWPTSGA